MARDLIDQALASDRFTLLLLSSHASVAPVMAALGIAGLVVFTVTQRTREIGIRIALSQEKRSESFRDVAVGGGSRWAANESRVHGALIAR